MTITAQLHRAQGSLTTLSDGRHAWAADVDKPLGGTDLAPDPHALLDAALAACTTLTLELYIRRRNMAVTDLRVIVEHTESRDAEGQSIYQLNRQIHIDGALSDEDRAKLLEIANKCPIHRTLLGDVRIESALV